MYQKSSDTLHYLARTGSHSTKESKKGIIRNIPKWAKEPEDYYNLLSDQFEITQKRLEEHKDRLQKLREKKNIIGPDIQSEYDSLLGRVTELDADARRLRALVHAASTNSWGTVFYLCCQTTLSPDDFKRVDDEVRALLQRERKPIQKLDASHHKTSKNRIKALKRSLKNQETIFNKKIARLKGKK